MKWNQVRRAAVFAALLTAWVGAAAAPASAQTPTISVPGTIEATQPSSSDVDFSGQPTSVYDGGLEVVTVRFNVRQQTQVQFDVLSFFAFPTFLESQVRLYREDGNAFGPDNFVTSAQFNGTGGPDLNGSPSIVDPFLDVNLPAGTYVVAFGANPLDDAEVNAGVSNGALQGDATQSLPIRTGQYQLDIYGDVDQDFPISNVTQGTQFATIQNAVDTSDNGDVIELPAGTVLESGIVINGRELTIRGAGMAETAIDAQRQGTIFTMRNADVTIEGMALRNGLADAANGGGAMVAQASTVIARDVELSGHHSNGFGAGAVYLDGVVNARFERSVFRDNVSTISSIAVPHLFHLGAGSLDIVSCLFAGASAPNSVAGSSMRIASSNGGSLNARIRNSTFADLGGDIRHLNFLQSGVSGDVSNCVFDDNGITAVSFAGSRIALNNNVYNNAPAGNIDAVPVFIDPANGDYRLAAGSPGIDAADADAYLAAGGGFFDLAGGARTNNDAGVADTGVGAIPFLDAGAYEFQGNTLTADDADFNNDGAVDTFDLLDLLILIDAFGD